MLILISRPVRPFIVSFFFVKLINKTKKILVVSAAVMTYEDQKDYEKVNLNER